MTCRSKDAEQPCQVLGRGAKYPTLNWPLELNGQHRLDDELEAPLAKDESAAPAPVKAKKAVKPGLQPEDVQWLGVEMKLSKLQFFLRFKPFRTRFGGVEWWCERCQVKVCAMNLWRHQD